MIKVVGEFEFGCYLLLSFQSLAFRIKGQVDLFSQDDV